MPVRLLRPSLRTSERWHRSSYFDRCFYISILNLVDDFGRYEANPALLASECFPYGDEHGLPVTCQAIDGSLRALASKDLIKVYQRDGKRFVQLTRWKERTRASSSHFPDPEDCQIVWSCEQMPANASKRCQTPASPPSPSPSPSPSPVPTPTPSPAASVCVQVQAEPEKPKMPEASPLAKSIAQQKAEFQESNRLQWLYQELCKLYRRPPKQRMDYAEESVISAIARRPDSQAELKAIQDYRRQLPSKDVRFFPQSLMRLIERWDEILDRARNYQAPAESESILSKQIQKNLEEAQAL